MVLDYDLDKLNTVLDIFKIMLESALRDALVFQNLLIPAIFFDSVDKCLKIFTGEDRNLYS